MTKIPQEKAVTKKIRYWYYWYLCGFLAWGGSLFDRAAALCDRAASALYVRSNDIEVEECTPALGIQPTSEEVEECTPALGIQPTSEEVEECTPALGIQPTSEEVEETLADFILWREVDELGATEVLRRLDEANRKER